MRRATSVSAVLLAVGLLVSVSGCAGSGQSRSATQVQSIQLVRTRVDEAAKQMDSTIASLEGVVAAASSDPKPAYAKFVSDLKELDSKVADLRSRAAAMRKRSENYFTEWDAQVRASITNPEIAKKSTERRAQIQQQMTGLKDSMEGAKKSYGHVSSDLHDVKSYLDLDLNQSGIQSIADQVAKIKQNGQEVHSALESIRSKLKELADTIGTITPPPPAAAPSGTPPPAGSAPSKA